MLFSLVSREWLVMHSVGIKPRTVIMYKEKVNKLIKIYENINIEDILYTDIQIFINDLYLKNNFAKQTIKKYKITLNLIFKYAMSRNIIDKNPCDFINIPKNAKVSKRMPLNKEDISIILNNINSSYFSLYPFMLFCLGIRRSEILPLKFEDINFDNRIIIINKVVNFINNKPQIDNFLKNGSVGRNISIPDILFEKIESYRNLKGYIFHKNKKLLTESQLEDLWEDYKDRTGFKGTQHMIRHSYATMLYKSNVDIKTAQYLLGHKTVKTTLDIYTHLEEDLKIKNISKLNKYMNTLKI